MPIATQPTSASSTPSVPQASTPPSHAVVSLPSSPLTSAIIETAIVESSGEVLARKGVRKGEGGGVGSSDVGLGRGAWVNGDKRYVNDRRPR